MLAFLASSVRKVISLDVYRCPPVEGSKARWGWRKRRPLRMRGLARLKPQANSLGMRHQRRGTIALLSLFGCSPMLHFDDDFHRPSRYQQQPCVAPTISCMLPTLFGVDCPLGGLFGRTPQ